jgi:predicted DNA-binding protein (MmcQ/YjbR family)
MIDQKMIEEDLGALENVSKSYPYDKTTAVYSVGETMFALLNEGTSPVKLSLRCDPRLAKILRDKYETIMPAHNLNKELWNTVILSGQLSRDELKGLIRHAYELAAQSQS